MSHPLLDNLIAGVQLEPYDPVAGNRPVARNMATFLNHHGYQHVAGHCAQVAAEARRLAECFGADPAQAEIGGWMHDISAPIPNSERVAAAEALGITVLPEERTAPMIIHQKLSVVLARDLFGVTNTSTLSAIGCHTTLKKGATMMDKILFIADKIKWDQAGTPPYLNDLLADLERSLDAATLCYLTYLWDQRESLLVIHPWLVDALNDLGYAT